MFIRFCISAGGIDYTEVPSPSQGTLNENVPTSCFNVTTLSDSEVEGREDMGIQFMFTDRFGSFIPADTGNIAVIEIIDDDCKLHTMSTFCIIYYYMHMQVNTIQVFTSIILCILHYMIAVHTLLYIISSLCVSVGNYVRTLFF